MKHKKLHTYVLFLLSFCILLGLILSGLVDFYIGFFAGWNHIQDNETAFHQYGSLSQIISLLTISAIWFLTCVYCYRKLRRKVTRPIEELACQMHEVSQGNLATHSPSDGAFEIVEIQEAFNSMVEDLKHAKELRERTAQKNLQLYSGIAHDLKTPMTMIMGYAKLLEQNPSLSEETKKQYLQTIVEQTAHTNALLDSLLAYTKLENQAYPLHKESQDIAECLRECIANCYPMIEEANIQPELLLPEHPVEYCFDSLEMKRVFTNLLSNLVRHNPAGTACIIQLDETSDTEKGCRNIRILVADNGPKIPEPLRSSVFDSFVVGDDSRNTKNGSGLGLAISKRIIERHGGQLTYVNEWRDGYKCFQIELKQDARMLRKFFAGHPYTFS